MKETILKVARIGNSRGIRIPARVMKKYQIGSVLLMEEGANGILLRPQHDKKLSWAETFKEMGETKEDWKDFESIVGDGLDDL